jgi:hypothetical protein
MAETKYAGLAEFGLPLIAKDNPSFNLLVSEIESHPGPGLHRPPFMLERAAVLLNNTGRAIVAMQWFWRYVEKQGEARISQFSNLGSSAQRDALAGRLKAGRDLGTYILPGSKRLITEGGIFGNNLDVLTPEELPRSQGYCGGWGGGNSRQTNDAELENELILDLVILEDGLCVGPNELGLYEGLNEALDLQRTSALDESKHYKPGHRSERFSRSYGLWRANTYGREGRATRCRC